MPEGDILVHAGDISHGVGAIEECLDFNEWLGELPYKHKIMIPGNHDFQFQESPDICQALMTNCHLLIDDYVIIDGIKFYGSPWQPWFHDWAFNLQRGEEIAKVWAKIPKDTDVLITHGPPYNILDTVERGRISVGCEELAKKVMQVNPKVHIFGHIHEGYGQLEYGGTLFVNASICTFLYQATNAPTVIDI